MGVDGLHPSAHFIGPGKHWTCFACIRDFVQWLLLTFAEVFPENVRNVRAIAPSDVEFYEMEDDGSTLVRVALEELWQCDSPGKQHTVCVVPRRGKHAGDRIHFLVQGLERAQYDSRARS